MAAVIIDDVVIFVATVFYYSYCYCYGVGAFEYILEMASGYSLSYVTLS